MPNRSGRHSSKAAASASGPGSDISGSGISGSGISGNGISGNCIRADGPRRYLAVVREPLTAQAEPGVEAGAEVLQCDPGGQLDELGITQLRPDASGQLVGDLGWAARRRLGVLQHDALALIEEIARAPV